MLNTLFGFNGRSGRGGLWLTAIIAMVLSIVALILAQAVSGEMFTMTNADGTPLQPGQVPDENVDFSINWNSVYTYLLMALPATWIYLAGSVKRCHDRGKSGWWMLLILIPFVGGIWWLIDLGVLEGEQGPNKYGPDPRATTSA